MKIDRAVVQEGPMASVIFAIAAMLVLALPLDVGAQPSCGCPEMRNVKNRLCETRAAQQEYDRIASKFLAAEQKAGKPILLAKDLKEHIHDTCVQEALDAVADSGAQDAKGETDGLCEVYVTPRTRPHLPASQCIEESVTKHESFHYRQCKRREGGRWERVWSEGAPVRSGFDTKFAMSVVDFLAEEHAAYMMEEADLTETLRRLANTCKPAEKIVTVATPDEVPGKKAGDKYSLDLSVERCPRRPRASPSQCKY